MSDRSEEAVFLNPPRGRVTLEAVARAAGLGRTTVSDILNRNLNERYSSATRQRVDMAVRKLGYAPVGAAQQLARGRSGQIGLMLTRDFSNPFFARVADLVERLIRSNGFRLQISITDGDSAHELNRVRQMHSDAVEGLIVGPVYEPLDIEQHRNVFRGNLPIVLFGGSFECEFDQITLDSRAGLAMGLDLLRDNGHRRIGFLCAPPSRLRPGGSNPDYLAVRIYQQRGVYDPRWFNWQEDTGRFEDFFGACVEFARRWKSAQPSDRPTAMLCHNDQVAMTAIAAFDAEGIDVPDAISLVGYDNLPESGYLTPAVTTIDSRADEQMHQTVRQLLHRIAQPDAERKVIVISPTLIERKSVKNLN